MNIKRRPGRITLFLEAGESDVDLRHRMIASLAKFGARFWIGRGYNFVTFDREADGPIHGVVVQHISNTGVLEAVEYAPLDGADGLEHRKVTQQWTGEPA